jgi:hypothetical protein
LLGGGGAPRGAPPHTCAPSRAGKRLWVAPETGKRLPEAHAFALVREEERRLLIEAGWECVEVDGETYWRRPGTGRLYPPAPAVDVLRHYQDLERGQQ